MQSRCKDYAEPRVVERLWWSICMIGRDMSLQEGFFFSRINQLPHTEQKASVLSLIKLYLKSKSIKADDAAISQILKHYVRRRKCRQHMQALSHDGGLLNWRNCRHLSNLLPTHAYLILLLLILELLNITMSLLEHTLYYRLYISLSLTSLKQKLLM